MTTHLSNRIAARELLRLTEEGQSVALLQVVSGGESEPGGGRLLVPGPGQDPMGTLGDPELDSAGLAAGRRALAHEEHAAEILALPAETGGTKRVFVEVHHPADAMVIVGAGHIAQPLAEMGVLQGLRVTVLDDRPEWARKDRFPDPAAVLRVDFDDPFRDVPIHPRSHVVLVTRGHRYDYECLVRLLRLDPPPAYIGMIGSRRRVRATFAQLGAEGFGPEAAARVWAPIGLDIGAQTPTEIAIAVAAEIVLARRGGTGEPLRSLERVASRFMDSDAARVRPREEETK